MENLQNKYTQFLSKNEFIKKLNLLFCSKYYPLIIGLLMIICNIFALEGFVYTILFILTITNLLISKETRGTIPSILFFQLGMSYKNGLSFKKDPSIPNIYSHQWFVIYLIVLGSLVVLSAIFNLVIFKQYKNGFSKSLPLLPGAISLAFAYLLSGVFSKGYSLNNFLFSISNVGMNLAIFLYFSNTSYQTLNKKQIMEHLSYIMVATSLIVIFELVYIYISNGIIGSDGSIQKYKIQTGWGLQNSMAALLLYTYPFVFYLTLKEENKRKIPFIVLLILIPISIFFTLARTSIIFIFIQVFVFIIYLIYKSKLKKSNLILLLLISIDVVSLLYLAFEQKMFYMFKSMFAMGLSSDSRLDLYKTGFEHLFNNPIFGFGWFGLHDPGYYAPSATFFAPNLKYHNIVVQILASTGLFGMVGFIILLSNITSVTFNKIDKEKSIIFFTIIVILASSLIDNFFFDYIFERYIWVILGCLSIISLNNSYLNNDLKNDNALVNA